VIRVLLLALIVISWTLGPIASFIGAEAIAQDATPAADCVMTTPEENKAIIHAWFAALSSGSGEDVAALAAEDIIYHDPSPDEEAQTGGTEDWADERQQDYPDLDVTVEQIVAEGDLVASLQRYVGTQEGDIEEEMGFPATGLPTEWVGTAQFRIECGKIAEIWSVADDLGRLQRLGVITDEELQSVEPVATPTS
jgi:steroid delta-isomerase-like uncharacterized protein